MSRCERAADERSRTTLHRFECASVADAGVSVDALVGRFVLMHQADPTSVLRAAARHVRAGGVVAFLESHMIGSVAGVHSWPHAPLYERVLRTMVAVVTAAGAHPDMGLRLRRTFLDAGLPDPKLWLQTRVDDAADAEVHHYVAESLRSMVPLGASLGVDLPSPAEIADLETALRAETAAVGAVLTSWLLVGAWCRL